MRKILQNRKIVTLAMAALLMFALFGCADADREYTAEEAAGIRSINNRAQLSAVLGDVDLEDIEIINARIVNDSLQVFAHLTGDSHRFENAGYQGSEIPESIFHEMGLVPGNIWSYEIREGQYNDLEGTRKIYLMQIIGDHSFQGNIIFVTDLPDPNVTINIRRLINE